MATANSRQPAHVFLAVSPAIQDPLWVTNLAGRSQDNHMNPSVLREKPVFICGHPKAGTSLLRAILDAHPQLIVYPEETIFFRRFFPRARSLDLSAQLKLAETELIHIFQWNRQQPVASQKGYPDRDYSSTPYDQVRDELYRLAGEEHRHPGDILSAAVLAYGLVNHQLSPQSTWWVEKSPYNEYFADQIFDWWPQARCIHIVRDPRDNFVSYQRKHPGWEAEFFSKNWLRSTQAGVQNQRRFSPEKYMLLRYEDLTSSPQERINDLVSFLKIEWDDSLAEPTRAGEQWQGNSMFSNQFESISSAPVARWKEKLDQSDAAVISLMTRPIIETLGYCTTAEIYMLSEKNHTARWRAASWPVRRYFRKLQKK